MLPGDSFARLMARLKTGDDDAAAAVWQRFIGRLKALACKNLEVRIRRREDADDVVNSAYKSFCLGLRAGKYDGEEYRFHTWDDVWSMLATITVCKCRKRGEHHHAQRRDVAREVDPGHGAEELDRRWETADPEPTPLEAAILAETVELLLLGWDDDQRAMIELSLQGYTIKEISEQLGRAERTVRRMVHQRLPQRLKRILADQPFKP